MPLFKIERAVAGLDRDERVAMGYRAVAALSRYPEVRWVRSYIDVGDEQLTCLYRAPSIEALKTHQLEARLSWLAITEVTEFDPAHLYDEAGLDPQDAQKRENLDATL